MSYTFPITKDMVKAKSTLSISQKHATIVCRAINKKNYKEATEFIKNLASEKKSLEGKYYTKTSKEILMFLKTLGSNAEALNKDADKMKLMISAHKGPTLMRGRRKWRFGRQMKICKIQAVLKGEKNGTGKSVREKSNKNA
ncbi:MAG: hypothetical protein KJ906_04215 [Nanoarchaeota archaeon]|nr:hypothetical protein [Nanoarchaeota archaeon]